MASKYTHSDIATLIFMLEEHEEGQYLSICNRLIRARDEGRTNVRLSFSDKDALAYKLESDMISPEEIAVIEKVTGSKYSDWHRSL